jgi:YkoY family integral membrane protein
LQSPGWTRHPSPLFSPFFSPVTLFPLDPLQGHGPLACLATVLALGVLEAVLSGDNAVALAGIVRTVEPPEERERVLNLGILLALVLRGAMLLAAGWILQFAALRVLGGLYLLWLALRHVLEASDAEPADTPTAGRRGIGGVILQLACTDLAFSIDSISASVAVTEVFPLVLLGGAMGLLMLRCLTGWLLAWMERYPKLQRAAYLTVLAVGLRMVVQGTLPSLAPSEPILLMAIACLFLWGFSQRSPLET